MTEPEARRDEPRTEEPAARLTEDMAEITRHERLKIRDPLVEAVRGTGVTAALLAGAGFFGTLAVLAGTGTALRPMETRMPPVRAAATLTGAYLGASAALALLAVGRVRRAESRSAAVTRELRRVMRASMREANR
ncbi:phage holin family protein [Dactylosporangium sp. CA-139114]|uniref:phage holin family protein n=1 Tax=Dactylosporangium sp. CA-139114 TaxID=3239931 RepID=UPI003D977801